jgi:hypothetical protein
MLAVARGDRRRVETIRAELAELPLTPEQRARLSLDCKRWRASSA